MIAQPVSTIEQAGQFPALPLQSLLKGGPALFQVRQGRSLLLQRGLGLGQRAAGPRDLLVHLAQLAAGLAALVVQLPALLRHTLQLGPQLLQLALGFTGGLRACRQRRHQRQAGNGEQRHAGQAQPAHLSVAGGRGVVAQGGSNDFRQMHSPAQHGDIFEGRPASRM